MWRVFSASATGIRNLERGAPGQDACHWRAADDWLVAAVCDGAGSVAEGRAGAEFVAHQLVERLAGEIKAGGSTETEGSASLDAILRAGIESVRARLAELALERQLALEDYACTLVGCVTGAAGGVLFHVGDGVAIEQGPDGQAVLSAPENGEFADETYFVTDASWHEHLRLTPLPPAELGAVIGLMSDGTAPFAVNRERSGFFRPFLDPVAAFLRASTVPDGNAALQNLLESPRASEISPDDKTLLLAFVL